MFGAVGGTTAGREREKGLVREGALGTSRGLVLSFFQAFGAHHMKMVLLNCQSKHSRSSSAANIRVARWLHVLLAGSKEPGISNITDFTCSRRHQPQKRAME